MNQVITSLEQISRMAKGTDVAKAAAAIEKTREILRQASGGADVHSGAVVTMLERLDEELATWQSKLPVIFKEPAGRQGMAKHALYWVEQLKKI